MPRDRFPWLLAAGPAIVVVASLATMVLAITHDDGVVARDYYKLGLTVNRRIAAAPPPVADGTATLSISGAGEVRVRLDGVAPAPASLAITLHRPGAPGRRMGRVGGRAAAGTADRDAAGGRLAHPGRARRAPAGHAAASRGVRGLVASIAW